MNHIRIFRQYIPAYIVLLVLFEYVAMVAAVYAAHSLRFQLFGGLADVDFSRRAVARECLCHCQFDLYDRDGCLSAAQPGGADRIDVALDGGDLFDRHRDSVGRVLFVSIVCAVFRSRCAGDCECCFAARYRAVAFRRACVGWQRDAALAGVDRRCWPARAARVKHLDQVEGAGGYRRRRLLAGQRAPSRTFRSIRLVEPQGTLLEFSRKRKVQEIIVAVDERRRSGQNSFPLEELLDCKLDGIAVIDDLTFLERESGQLDIRTMSPGWLVFSDGFSFSFMRDLLERGFDVVASLLLLLLTWPLMLLAVLAIKLEEGLRAPIIYSQERVGFGGRIFRVHKFRSMRVDAEKDGKARWAQKNDSRVTRTGQFIRNTRIDELPQIFNVLKGEMSFVGPRPERPQFVEELAQQIPYYRERHRVKPGITGWAQLCYPYGASVEDAEQKLTYDLYYIKNHSLIFDLYILVRTVEVILLGTGVR